MEAEHFLLWLPSILTVLSVIAITVSAARSGEDDWREIMTASIMMSWLIWLIWWAISHVVMLAYVFVTGFF